MSNLQIFKNKTEQTENVRDTILIALDTSSENLKTKTDNIILLPDVNLNYDNSNVNPNRTVTDPTETTTQYLISSTESLNVAISETHTDYILNYNRNNNSIKWIARSSESESESFSTEEKQDVMENTLNAIQVAVEGNLTVNTHQVTNAGIFPVQSTLQASTAVIGKLAANSGVNIGSVGVTSISEGANRIGMVGLKANESVDGSGNERHLLCDSAGHLQVDVISSEVTNSGTFAVQSTLQTGTAVIGKLAANSGVDIGDVGITGLPLTFNSGNKDSSTQRVVIATDDVNLTAIKTATEAIVTDQAAIEILQTTANSKLTTIDSVLDNILIKNGEIKTSADALIIANHTDLEALEASLTSMEGKQDNMITDLAAIEITQNTISGSIKAKQSAAGNTDTGITSLAVRNDTCADLTGADHDYAPLQVNGSGHLYIHDTSKYIKDDDWLTAATIAAGGYSDVFDTLGFKEIVIYGESTTAVSNKDYIVFGSNAELGTYYSCGNISVADIDSRYHLFGDKLQYPIPRYLKIYNDTGGNLEITALRVVMADKYTYLTP